MQLQYLHKNKKVLEYWRFCLTLFKYLQDLFCAEGVTHAVTTVCTISTWLAGAQRAGSTRKLIATLYLLLQVYACKEMIQKYDLARKP